MAFERLFENESYTTAYRLLSTGMVMKFGEMMKNSAGMALSRILTKRACQSSSQAYTAEYQA